MTEPDFKDISADGDSIDIRYIKAGGKWTASVLGIRSSILDRRKRERRKRRERAIRSAAELAAGLVLGIVAMAVADTATTSLNLRLGIAVAVCIAGVLAEWGVRVAAHKARRRDLSTRSERRNLSNRLRNRRWGRG